MSKENFNTARQKVPGAKASSFGDAFNIVKALNKVGVVMPEENEK